MSDDIRDVSQLRVELKDYILDAETEIRQNLKVGIFRGQNDPTVVRMQQVVDALIAKVRQDERAAALRDAVEVVGRIVPVWNPMVDASVVDGNEVMAAIEALQRQQAAVELTRMAQEDGLL
jgi:hypothetical protein